MALGKEAKPKHLGTSVLKRGYGAWGAKAINFESRRPLRGVYRRLIGSQGRHRLESGAMRVPGRQETEYAVENKSLRFFFTLSEHLQKGAAKNRYIFSRPCFVMACYAYSVLTSWFKSVYSGAGSVLSSHQEARQQAVII